MIVAPIPLLLYHSISNDPPPWAVPWTVSPDRFRGHMDELVESGATPLTISALVDLLRAEKPLPRGAVAVTFDDGFADFGTTAAPIMAERGIAHTLYVTTGALLPRTGRGELRLQPAPMLGWSQLAELEAMGTELGGHSHTHPELDTLPPTRARDEVVRPKDLLEDLLGHPVHSFAYPHGYSSPRVRRLVADAGYQSACGVRDAFSFRQDNPFSLARIVVQPDATRQDIRFWLHGMGARIIGSEEWHRTQLWRWFRRGRSLCARPMMFGSPFTQ
ncbi:MAG TPA: polysaccharide deacetylase family protein [Acidimicrobiales bacterium]|nr:polysaccharide deacetylase family protein [Acidimicrobiales bacterium]